MSMASRAAVFGGIALAVFSCAPRDVKFNQYYAEGQHLYEVHCSNCHQKTGKGLGLVYPPLQSSDYLDKNLETVLCLMKYGVRGSLRVNGNEFNQPMPGVRSLTELELAEVATYIYNTWGNERGLIDVADVTPIVARCAP